MSVAISLQKTGAMNTAITLDFTNAISADGCTVPIGKDERLLIIATNSDDSPHTVVVAKGDSVNGAAADLSISIAAGAYVAFELDSSRYGQMSGANKGKFSIMSDSGADVTLTPVQLV